MTTADIHNILGIDEYFKAPSALMNILLNKELRIDMFKKFLKIETDLSYDWFHYYFMSEQADRTEKKQDFTPDSLCDLVSQLTGNFQMCHELAAGTGGIIIRKWNNEIKKVFPWLYDPSSIFFHLEELSDRAIPFLLFNLSIRGINASVIHGDTLERNAKGVFFVYNVNNSPIGFSDINILPYSEDVMNYFNIHQWTDNMYSQHIESDFNNNFYK